LLVYFCGIGLGFMLVEIALLQRLIIFLGHPTYGLSVVLFAMLLSSGLGSWTTERIAGGALAAAGRARLAALLVVLSVLGLVAQPLMAAMDHLATPVRILVAIVLIFPAGFFMGMAFPMGMKVAARGWEAVTPWLWGLNGALSVTASVLAMALSLAFSISGTYWVGVACYVGVLASFVAAARRMQPETA
jgi:uncharacterized membrane protein YciS (DUF1049 family)